MYNSRQSSLKMLRNKALDNVLDWAEIVVMSVFVVLLFFIFLSRIYVVEGNSMKPTLYDNDKLLIQHNFYTPQIGDIVVIDSTALEKPIVKRVIGLSGDVVVINYDDRSVCVNGKELDENNLNEFMTDLERFDKSYFNEQTNCYEYVVPDNCVFVLGDNRNHSSDSREIGFVDCGEIVGKVYFRLLSDFGGLGFI